MSDQSEHDEEWQLKTSHFRHVCDGLTSVGWRGQLRGKECGTLSTEDNSPVSDTSLICDEVQEWA